MTQVRYERERRKCEQNTGERGSDCRKMSTFFMVTLLLHHGYQFHCDFDLSSVCCFHGDLSLSVNLW